MTRERLSQGVHPALQPIKGKQMQVKERKRKCYGLFFQQALIVPKIETCLRCKYYNSCKLESINKKLEIRKKALK